jgi:hypothetical protein
VQLNTVPIGAEFLPQNQNPQNGTPLNDNYYRPYPGYNGVPQQIFEGNSSYHSLQVKADRRFAKGLQFGVAYTRSKAFDYAEGDSTGGGLSTPTGASAYSAEVARYFDRKVWNYGLALYDRPNVLTFHFLWDIPKLSRVAPNRVLKAIFDDWQLSDITSFINGQPLGVSMSTNPTVNFLGGGDGVRPIMVGNPILPKDQRTFDRYFNVAAFAEPIALTPGQTSYNATFLNFGNMPRLVLRAPGTNNWQMSLFKNVVVKERYRIQLRTEAYNVFNHTQFSSVNTGLQFNAARAQTSQSVGQISSARNPRVMQFALRLSF